MNAKHALTVCPICQGIDTYADGTCMVCGSSVDVSADVSIDATVDTKSVACVEGDSYAVGRPDGNGYDSSAYSGLIEGKILSINELRTAYEDGVWGPRMLRIAMWMLLFPYAIAIAIVGFIVSCLWRGASSVMNVGVGLLFMPRGGGRNREDIAVSEQMAVVEVADGTHQEISLYGQQSGGSLHRGDWVRVYGKRLRSGVIRVSEIRNMTNACSIKVSLPGAVWRSRICLIVGSVLAAVLLVSVYVPWIMGAMA